jgi:hypothetical protein
MVFAAAYLCCLRIVATEGHDTAQSSKAVRKLLESCAVLHTLYLFIMYFYSTYNATQALSKQTNKLNTLQFIECYDILSTNDLHTSFTLT